MLSSLIAAFNHPPKRQAPIRHFWTCRASLAKRWAVKTVNIKRCMLHSCKRSLRQAWISACKVEWRFKGWALTRTISSTVRSGKCATQLLHSLLYFAYLSCYNIKYMKNIHNIYSIQHIHYIRCIMVMYGQEVQACGANELKNLWESRNVDKDLKFELSFTSQCENLHSQQVPAAREAVSFGAQSSTTPNRLSKLAKPCAVDKRSLRSHLICSKEARSQSWCHVNHNLP